MRSAIGKERIYGAMLARKVIERERDLAYNRRFQSDTIPIF